MSRSQNVWLHRFAVLTALASLILIAVGGLVTSKDAGMSVPDWPNSYGYNMFLFPVSKWVGGILWEHSHRLTASIVGVLVVALTRWLGGSRSRVPLTVIGLLELLAGFALLRLSPELKGAGYFLSGIGGVVLAAGVVWLRNEASGGALPMLGWIAFAAVQAQGLLGGLRVVLSVDQLGIFHAALAQLFFALLCTIALLTSGFWRSRRREEADEAESGRGLTALHDAVVASEALEDQRPDKAGTPYSNGQAWSRGFSRLTVVITVVIFFQLLLGATMRHQHAGLSIPDFPLAYGKLWPATDPASIQLYNQQRLETTTANPITAFQVGLQMVHRIIAVVILTLIGMGAWRRVKEFGVKSPTSRLFLVWFGLVLLQASLGAATIWSNKAADIATAHVVVGALLLANGALLCLIVPRTAPAEALSLEPSQGTAFAGQAVPAGAKS